MAQKELIIIDGYADKTTLDMIKDLKAKVTIIAKPKRTLKTLDIEKYNEQYNNLTVIYDDSFHDRYIIVDKNKIYHCGASINHAGKRTFSINILEDKIITKNLLKNIKELSKSINT